MVDSKTLVEHEVGRGRLEVVLPTLEFVPGDAVPVDVRLTGRSLDAVVDEVTLALAVPYLADDGYRKATVGRYTLASEVEVDSGFSETSRSTITVPYEVPAQVGGVDVLATVGIEANGTSITDEIHFDVRLHPAFEASFHAMIDLGFAVEELSCVADRSPNDQRFVQRLAFRPIDGPFEDAFEEVVLYPRLGEDGLTLFGSFDSPATADGFRADGAKTHLRDASAAPERLHSFLERNVPT